jgi:hypothetical protein
MNISTGLNHIIENEKNYMPGKPIYTTNMNRWQIISSEKRIFHTQSHGQFMTSYTSKPSAIPDTDSS